MSNLRDKFLWRKTVVGKIAARRSGKCFGTLHRLYMHLDGRKDTSQRGVVNILADRGDLVARILKNCSGSSVVLSQQIDEGLKLAQLTFSEDFVSDGSRGGIAAIVLVQHQADDALLHLDELLTEVPEMLEQRDARLE